MATRVHEHATPWKRLALLIVMICALLVSLLVGSVTGSKENRWAPGLALDLQGGTQIVLTPVVEEGYTITDADIDQAIDIIRQRVDASGVAEAEITAQGGQNIVVGLPGTPSKETLDLVRNSAVLRLRPVLTRLNPEPVTAESYNASLKQQQDAAKADAQKGDSGTDKGAATAAPGGEATAAPSGEPSGQPSAQPSGQPSSEPSAAPSAPAEEPKGAVKTAEEAAMAIADVNHDGKLEDKPATKPANSSDEAWVTEKVMYDALLRDCVHDNSSNVANDPAAPIVACEKRDVRDHKTRTTHTVYYKYILGPAELEGKDITQATSNPAVSSTGQATGGWAVNLKFDSKGADIFADVTGRLVNLPEPRNIFAIVLDGKVISAAAPTSRIAGGAAQITGSFTSAEATTLANQLSFGSLPLTFQVQSEEQISATLGTEQLESGLIAGLVGLALIVLYMLWQYHALGIVAIGSIVLTTGLSYFLICLLSWTMGYRLSMAGVVGLIISIGISADSFIVYFERIRDEIREGRSLNGSVHSGWNRAKRTIIVSDAVNLLAALVLYFLAVGGVRGFAFTLGLTTIIDLVVVMMFTYPLMTMLIRTDFFGHGRRGSGMDAAALGASPVYRGRGRVETSRSSKKKSDGETSALVGSSSHSGMTVAERKAAERRAKNAQAHGTEGGEQ